MISDNDSAHLYTLGLLLVLINWSDDYGSSEFLASNDF